MKHIYLILISVFIATSAFAQGIEFQQKSWKKVKKQAQKSDKLIFVDAYTTWCGPCKWMAAEVFTDEKVSKFYNDNFINLQLDMEKDEGLDFAQEYNVNAYPTLLFIDGNGTVVHKRLGAIPPEMFLEFGKEALDPDMRIGGLITEYEKGNRSSEFLQKYIGRMLAAGMDVGEAAEFYFGELNEEELITAENFEIIKMMRPSFESDQYETVLKNYEAFTDVAGQDEVSTFLKETSRSALISALYYDQPDRFKEVAAKIKDYKFDFSEEVLTYAYMLKAQREGNYDDYIDYTKKYARAHAWNDWEVLNSIAWGIYEDEIYAGKDYLNLGLKLAKQSIKVNENYYNTDTYAALFYKSGDYENALEWGEKAIAIAKSQDMDFAETSRLIAKIKEAMQ